MNTYFTTNYTNQREEFALFTAYNSNEANRVDVDTLSAYDPNDASQLSGQNRFVPDEKRFEFVINGKEWSDRKNI